MSKITVRNDEKTRVTQARRFKSATVIALIGAMALYGWFHLGASNANDSQETAAPTQPAPSVIVQMAEMEDFSTSKEYIGTVEPIQTVMIRPEISGKIEQVHFKEGSMVTEGQLLYTLDSKQYQATVALRKADLAKAQANYSQANKYLDRLKAADKRSVSESDLDVARNDVQQSKAAIDQAKASLDLAQIDLNNTKILSPISGRIGSSEFTKGNYVTPSATLAKIVQVDPVRVTFSMPDRDYLNQRSSFNKADFLSHNLTLQLANGEAYPHSGSWDFDENEMDSTTGTISTRLRFENDNCMLVPGSMVKIKVTSEERKAMLIPQEAILADREGDYVYIVDSAKVAHQKRISVGAYAGLLREVTSGLNVGDMVVIQGIQSLRPNTKVNVAYTQNPTSSKASASKNFSKDTNSIQTGNSSKTSAIASK